MSEPFRIGEAAISYHRSQFDKPGLGEEQSWQALAAVEPHQPTVDQRSGNRRDFRAAGLRATAPCLELEAFGHVEKNMSSSRRI
jgi:hypothetical protein